MKNYFWVIVAGLALVGCSHYHGDQGGTYNQSNTYTGDMSSPPASNSNAYDDVTRGAPSGAERTPGANEHSPPPVNSSPRTDQDFVR
jgi:hypothetical protein